MFDGFRTEFYNALFVFSENVKSAATAASQTLLHVVLSQVLVPGSRKDYFFAAMQTLQFSNKRHQEDHTDPSATPSIRTQYRY